MWKKLLCRARPDCETKLCTMSRTTKPSRGSFLIRDLLAAKPDHCFESKLQAETTEGTRLVISDDTFGQQTIVPSWFASPLGLLFGIPPQYIATGSSWPSSPATNYSGICTNAERASEQVLPEISTPDNSEDQLESLDLSDSNRLSPSLLRKNRRNRTVFTEVQLMGLERRFDMQKYLSTPDRAELARALGLTQLQVKTWYQNRRMKWKKQVMQGGCPIPPTRPKGRPKKNSIPSRSDLDLPPMMIHDLSHIRAAFSRAGSGEACDLQL